MAQITGQTGRMNLNKTYVEFGDWNINVNDNDEPGLKEPWSGWLEIQKSDYHKILDSINKMNTEISAEFYGDKKIKYNGNIEITRFPYSSSDMPITIEFRGAGELIDILKKL